jgi:hypothetical protein
MEVVVAKVFLLLVPQTLMVTAAVPARLSDLALAEVRGHCLL